MKGNVISDGAVSQDVRVHCMRESESIYRAGEK